MSSDGIDESRPLTVSERRKQFESLALAGASSSTTSLSTLVSTHTHGAEHPLSPESRHRALSTTDIFSDNIVFGADRHLRQSSSNSDLNPSKRPVPPPPPPRTPKPRLISPLTSPNLRPTVITHHSAPVPPLQVDKQSLISRKPPPPPPTSVQKSETNSAEENSSNGNASVRERIS